MLRSIVRPSLISKFSSAAVRNASSLVIAERDPVSKKLTSATLSAITCATKIGGDISVVVIGKDVSDAAKHAAKIDKVSKVLTVDNDVFAHIVAEDVTPVLTELAPKYTHILAPSTNSGKNFLPRVAALLDSNPLSDCLQVIDEATFKRPMYAGNVIATVKMNDKHKFILVRGTAFDKAPEGSNNAPIEAFTPSTPVQKNPHTDFLAESAVKAGRPDLQSARVVVSGGRALGSEANFKIIEALADKFGGAVGASRAAVDAGYAPNDWQVGQTGKIVAPELYVAAGISGAIQHLSGMKDSKVIVAINKDKEAPIFQVADYGLVEDLFKAVPELTTKLEQR